MARQLPRRTVVMIGGGMTSALAARALVAKGVDVLVLERGVDRTHSAADEIPSQRDELRWALRHQNAQNIARETYTLRYASSETAVPRTIGTARAGGGPSTTRFCARTSRTATAQRRFPPS